LGDIRISASTVGIEASKAGLDMTTVLRVVTFGPWTMLGYLSGSVHYGNDPTAGLGGGDDNAQ
jgi:hypothetical protein